MKFGPVGAKSFIASCDLSIFVDEPAPSIDPYVRCWSGQWSGRER